MLAWRTSVHIKHIIALIPTWCHVFLYINKNMVYSSTPHRRDDRAVLFHIEPRFYPLLWCPIISLLSIYFCFRSLSLSYSCFLSPCVQWVWCFSFSLSEVVSGVQRWRVSGVRVSYWQRMKEKNIQIKTSVNCVNGRQTLLSIRGSSR